MTIRGKGIFLLGPFNSIPSPSYTYLTSVQADSAYRFIDVEMTTFRPLCSHRCWFCRPIQFIRGLMCASVRIGYVNSCFGSWCNIVWRESDSMCVFCTGDGLEPLNCPSCFLELLVPQSFDFQAIHFSGISPENTYSYYWINQSCSTYLSINGLFINCRLLKRLFRHLKVGCRQVDAQSVTRKVPITYFFVVSHFFHINTTLLFPV